jgi:signal transduction histidine kinase
VQIPSGTTRRQDGGTRRRLGLIDVGLCAAVLVVTLVRVTEDESVVIRPVGSPAELLVLLAAVAALIARSRPFVAVALAAVLDALPYWLSMIGAGYHLSVMIAIFAVVAYGHPKRRAALAAGAVFALQVSLMAADNAWQWSSVWVSVTGLSIAVPAALGLAARARAQTTAALEERAIAAEQSRLAAEEMREAMTKQLLAEDRLRTARDLHDSVAHQIAVMNLNAGVASQALRDRPTEAEVALVTVRQAGRAVISSISDLLTSLRDDDPGSRSPATYAHGDLQVLIGEFRKLFPDLTASVDGESGPAEPISPVLFSVVQEALTNIYKHGRHHERILLTVRLGAADSEVSVVNVVADEEPSFAEGFGLTGMRERVADAGGRVTIEKADGLFTLSACLPRKELTS